MQTAEETLKIVKFTNVVRDYQIDSILLAFNLKKKQGLLIHLNSVVCCYILDQISRVNKVQRHLPLKFLVTGVVGSDHCGGSEALQCYKQVAEVVQSMFEFCIFLKIIFFPCRSTCRQSYTASVCDDVPSSVQYMWKSLLQASRKSLRFCPAISTLFRQGLLT